MSKFSNTTATAVAPVGTTDVTTITHEGGAAYALDAKSELFLLATTNMVKEDTYYEAAPDRDERFVKLIHTVTQDDPNWVARFVSYLRNTVGMRSASIVMAAEYVRAGGPNGRGVVSSALLRADEPAEMLGYWTSHYGKAIPAAVKRGVADGAARLYNEYASIKYDGKSRKWRMGDVIELTHPKPLTGVQSQLFKYLIDKRHNRDNVDTSNLPIISKNKNIWSIPLEQRRAAVDDPTLFVDSGFTWEQVSGWIQGEIDWDAIIPYMGYMALLRNLRNFDNADISDASVQHVVSKLTNKDGVRASKQLPFRFFSAWASTNSIRWGSALETAMNISLENVPSVSGRTLVLIDTSGSMQAFISDKSSVRRCDIAAVFGAAFASKNDSINYIFATDTAVLPNNVMGGSILRAVSDINSRNGTVGHSTYIGSAIRNTYSGHDRIIVLTDMQSADNIDRSDVPIYIYDVGGYGRSAIRTLDGNKYIIGGFSDNTFEIMDLIERGKNANWPF